MDCENIGSSLETEDIPYGIPCNNTNIAISSDQGVPLQAVYTNQSTVHSSPILISSSHSISNSHDPIMKQEHMMPLFTNHMASQPQTTLPPTNTANKPSKKEPEIVGIIEVRYFRDS